MFENGFFGSANDVIQNVTNDSAEISNTVNNSDKAIDYAFNNEENLKESSFDIMQSNDPLKQAHLFKCTPFPGTHWVDSYIRENGTYVTGHLKTNPDSVTWNNLNETK